MDSINSTVKTPEAETPTRIQPVAANGYLKRHAPLQLHHPVVLLYKECVKNHAAHLGTYAADGCGEFMLTPKSDPANPTSMSCAACGCHRNFHRREDEALLLPTSPNAIPSLEYHHYQCHLPAAAPPPPGGSSQNNSPSPPPITSAYYTSAPGMLLAFGYGGRSAPPSDGYTTVPTSRKRFRTKFTSYQKEKMVEFAEKVAWKLMKKDEDAIAELCNHIGVDKGVLKVWMHNNKHTYAKKAHVDAVTDPPAATAEGGGASDSVMGAAAEDQQENGGEDNADDHIQD